MCLCVCVGGCERERQTDRQRERDRERERVSLPVCPLGMCVCENASMQNSAMYGIVLHYWAIQRSWFARVNALCNLSRKKS